MNPHSRLSQPWTIDKTQIFPPCAYNKCCKEKNIYFLVRVSQVTLERQVLPDLRVQLGLLGSREQQEILVLKAPRATVVLLVLQELSVISGLKGRLASWVRLEPLDLKVTGAPRELLEPRALMVPQDLLDLSDLLVKQEPKGRREVKDQMGNLDQRVQPVIGEHKEHLEAQGPQEIKGHRDQLGQPGLKEPREAQVSCNFLNYGRMYCIMH